MTKAGYSLTKQATALPERYNYFTGMRPPTAAAPAAD